MDLVVCVGFNRQTPRMKRKVALKNLQNIERKPGLNDTELVSYKELWPMTLEPPNRPKAR